MKSFFGLPRPWAVSINYCIVRSTSMAGPNFAPWIDPDDLLAVKVRPSIRASDRVSKIRSGNISSSQTRKVVLTISIVQAMTVSDGRRATLQDICMESRFCNRRGGSESHLA